MYYSLKTSNNSFILTKSPILFSPPLNNNPSAPRKLSTLNSTSYNSSLSRAFSRAKLLAFTNPDLTYFHTFTYKNNQTSPKQVLYDIKQYIKTEKRQLELSSSPRTKNTKTKNKTNRTNKPSVRDLPAKPHSREDHEKNANPTELDKELHKTETSPVIKYIYVLETQKRGSIHVHMIANRQFTTHNNRNGYKTLTNWKFGYTTTAHITDLDQNFKPYLYLFKYMTKAQRVGSSFIHTSRGNSFAKIEKLDYDNYIDTLTEENRLYEEDIKLRIDQNEYKITKEYYRIREKPNSETKETL